MQAATLGVCIAAVATLSGCASIGPGTIASDRFHYNAALAKSANEQLLQNLVRLRYGEPLHWLEINSMLSQYQLEARASVTGGWNDLDVFTDPAIRALYNVDNDPSRENNASGSVAYQDRPTISYSPVQGEEFARRLLSPIPLSVVVFFVQAGWPVDEVFHACIAKMNDLSNKQLVAGAIDLPESKAFGQTLSLLRDLQYSGGLHGVIVPSLISGEEYLFMHANTETETQLRGLLGLESTGERLRLRSYSSSRGDDTVSIQTRSLLGVLQSIARDVEVPKRHIRVGWVEAGDGPPESSLVRVSRIPVRNAFVQVKHKGHWFYIEESDQRSKRTFSLLTYLYSLQAARPTDRGPLLTVPASGG